MQQAQLEGSDRGLHDSAPTSDGMYEVIPPLRYEQATLAGQTRLTSAAHTPQTPKEQEVEVTEQSSVKKEQRSLENSDEDTHINAETQDRSESGVDVETQAAPYEEPVPKVTAKHQT